MAPVGNREYSTLFISGSNTVYDNEKSRRKQSCWRSWNRLSSLQRSMTCLLVIFGTLFAVYLIPTLLHDYSNLEDVDSLSRKKQTGEEEFAPHDVEKEKNSVLEALHEVQRKAEEKAEKGEKSQHHELDDALKPGEAPLGILVPPAMPDDQPIKFNGPDNDRQRAVVNAFKHSWVAYKKYAWGHDELKPVTKTFGEWFGVGLTLVDALDTMFIMDLKEEFNDAKAWVETSLNLDVNKDVNLFECTIRILGGLLSAYHLSKEPVFLEKAKDVADRMMPAFSSGSPVPYSDVNLKLRTAHAPRWGPDSSTSEVSTIQLEFIDLSRITGDPKYEEAVNKVTAHLHSLPKKDGLVPIFINANTGRFRNTATITLGARGDSYYEYLLKMWLQSGKRNNMVKDDYLEAVEGMKLHLMKESEPNKLMYFGEKLSGQSFSPKMDHLVCFMGGSLALGAHSGLPKEHLELGKRLTETCWKMYEKMPTGLAPEIVYFNAVPSAAEDIIVKPADAHNLQRPETIESLFYLYRITGDKKYQDWGWQIFQSFEKYTRLPDGYSSIGNVRSISNPGIRNKMESFWLAETLKYLYLLMADDQDILPLNQWVFNTEAHPLPVRWS